MGSGEAWDSAWPREHVLQRGKLRLSEVKLLLKVTSLLRGRTGI